jgi:hypothetical protein
MDFAVDGNETKQRQDALSHMPVLLHLLIWLDAITMVTAAFCSMKKSCTPST